MLKIGCNLVAMQQKHTVPANIYLFKVNNRNPKKSCEISSKLTIKTPERRHGRQLFLGF